MNGTLLNAKIQRGYAIAAGKIGVSHAQYRPTDPLTPFATSIGNLPAAFNVAGSFAKQTQADQIFWQAIVDGSKLELGDYLLGLHTWCIVGLEPLMPVIAMRCTDTVSISRSTEVFSATDGLTQTLTQIASGIPCYIQLKKNKGYSAPVAFPAPTNTSAPMPEWIVYIGLGGITPDGFIQEGDLIQDENGNHWKVDAASNSTLTWQLAVTPLKPKS